jgi:hypothetical protein
MVNSVLELITLSSLSNAAEVLLLTVLLVLTLSPLLVPFFVVELLEMQFVHANISFAPSLELVSLSMVNSELVLTALSATSKEVVVWMLMVLSAETHGAVCSVAVVLLRLLLLVVVLLAAVTWVLLLATLLTATARTLVLSKLSCFKASVLKSVLLVHS